MSALVATLRVAGSIVTIDLPSTRPTIQPAAWAPVLTNAEAASAPARVKSFICLNMELLPFDRPGGFARADVNSYGSGVLRMQAGRRILHRRIHVFVRRG